MGPLIATLFTIVVVAVSSFAITNPNTSLENRVAAACVSEGGIYANGTGNCCSGLIKTNCGGSGSFAYCYCKKPATIPAPTPSTKSCTKRSCDGTSCNSQSVTVPYSDACPSSNCVSNADCAPATKSCTKRSCDGTSCNSQSVTVPYSDACPSSNCVSNADCAPATKSCTKRSCDGTSCNSQSVTVPYSDACPSSNCVSNADCAPAITPTATPIPTPVCKKLNESFSSIVPCCSNLVKIVSPYGTVCGNRGDCVPGAAKCQNDGLKSYVYVCDSSGYYQVNKTCDFGCNGNACKIAVCTSGAKRCNPDNGNELEICSSDGSSWKGQSCANGCINSACKILTCDGKPEGTQECNASGGYNYCKEGNWYNHDCESGTTCISGKCQMKGTKEKGEKCDSDFDCLDGFCYAGNQVLGGSPFDSTKTCHINSIAVIDKTQKDLSTNTTVGTTAITATLLAAPIVLPEILNLAAVGGGVLSIPTAAYVYATNIFTNIPTWVSPALEIAGTFPAVYEITKCQLGKCTSEEQAQAQETAFFTGFGIQQLYESQIGLNNSSYKSNSTSNNLKTFESTFDTSDINNNLGSTFEKTYDSDVISNNLAANKTVVSTFDNTYDSDVIANNLTGNNNLGSTFEKTYDSDAFALNQINQKQPTTVISVSTKGNSNDEKIFIFNPRSVEIGSGTFGTVYDDPDTNSVIKIFKNVYNPYNKYQLELYKKYGNKAPLLTYKGSVPDGFAQEKINNAVTLGDYVSQAGTFTPDEVNQAVDNLIQTQIITGEAHGDLARPLTDYRWGEFGYLHPSNILIQTNPTGGVNIIPIDYGGFSGVSEKMGLINSDPEFMQWEIDAFRSGLNSFVTNITK